MKFSKLCKNQSFAGILRDKERLITYISLTSLHVQIRSNAQYRKHVLYSVIDQDVTHTNHIANSDLGLPSSYVYARR